MKLASLKDEEKNINSKHLAKSASLKSGALNKRTVVRDERGRQLTTGVMQAPIKYTLT